jgi:hypothetical protein
MSTDAPTTEHDATDNSETGRPADAGAGTSVDAEHDERGPRARGRRGAGGPKVREARDPSRRAMEADAEAIRRQLRSAMSERDGAKLKKLRQQLAAVEAGGEPAPSDAPVPLATQQETKAETAAKPLTPEEVAEFKNLGGVAAGILAAGLRTTRYNLDRTIMVEQGGQLVDVSAQRALGDALAPVLAKYLPKALATPEGNLIAVAAAIWAAPAMEHAGELLGLGAPTVAQLPAQQLGKAAAA